MVTVVVGFESADSWYDHEGVERAYDARLDGGATPYHGRSVFLAGEYGVIENLTAVMLLSFATVRVLDGGAVPALERSSSDLRNAYVGFRLGVADRIGLGAASALSISAGALLPLGYRRNLIPAIGPGQVDLDLGVSFGHSFEPIPATAQAGLGYRFRSRMFGLSRTVACADPTPDDEGPVCQPEMPEGDYSDELTAHVEAIYTALDRFSLRLLGDLAWSLMRPEVAVMPAGIVQPSGFTQQRYVRFGGGLGVRLFGDTSINALVLAVPYGQNVLNTSQVIIGIESRF